jgi:hypothetical protein
MIEKPPLDEDLLVHFGVKGMRWGRRKAKSESDSTSGSKKMSTAKKVALGAAAVGGALAVAYLISRRGSTKISDVVSNDFVTGQRQNAKLGSNEFDAMMKQVRPKVPSAPSVPSLSQRFANTKANSVPPIDNAAMNARIDALRSQAKVPSAGGLVGDRQIRANVEGNRRLVDKAWRDQARIGLLKRDMDDTTNSLLKGNQQRLEEAARQRLNSLRSS